MCILSLVFVSSKILVFRCEFHAVGNCVTLYYLEKASGTASSEHKMLHNHNRNLNPNTKHDHNLNPNHTTDMYIHRLHAVCVVNKK